MKTKNRKIIGQILIWLALIVQVLLVIYLFSNATINFISLGYRTILLITIIMLLIGGLWGMRK
jgi:hypothetical protein